MRWFKNLKKWQKGGLIGCAVGILLAVIIILTLHQDSLGEWVQDSLGEWVANFHSIFFIIIWAYLGEYSLTWSVVYGASVAIVIFYGGLGALFGRFQ